MRLTSTCVLVLSAFAFAMPAHAGNRNGNGNGNAGGNDAAPGNSANAPGQVKKEEAAPSPQPTTTTQATTTVSGPTEGVKPSNETAHETHAQAQSDETKLYGNGQTAGQIAIDHGASGKTVLHGPGNSQPHKAAPCGGGHERDVHALNGKHTGACGGSDPSPTPKPSPSPSPTPGPPRRDDTPPTSATPPKTTPSTSDPAPPAPEPRSGGDAEPVTAEAQGALAGTEAAGGTLPFTGMTLWLPALVGMVLIATGLALRQIRTAAITVEPEHDRSDRARRPAGSSRTSVGGRSGR